jgi:aspartate racemase
MPPPDQTVAMLMIGLLGGMSWESSVLYEELINTEVRARLGGVHSADLIVRSYDFAQIEALQAAGDWAASGELLAADAARLEAAGAGVIVLCTNTMHKVADAIEAAITVPFLHLADATAAAVKAEGLDTVGLLGTKFTMEQDFYRDRLQSHGLTVVVPSEPERQRVHDIIYDELVKGELNRSSREEYLDIIDRLGSAGAQGVIAGCTEIELLITADDVFIPYFPTTALHAKAAVAAALRDT